MGHLSLSSMKLLFPSIFSFSSVFELNYEVGQLSKHVRNSYPISDNKSAIPFSVIHFDV